MFKSKFYVLTQPLDRFQRCRVKSCKFVFSCAFISPNSKMLPRFKKVTSLCIQKSNFCANRLVSLSWKPGLGGGCGGLLSKSRWKVQTIILLWIFSLPEVHGNRFKGSGRVALKNEEVSNPISYQRYPVSTVQILNRSTGFNEFISKR